MLHEKPLPDTPADFFEGLTEAFDRSEAEEEYLNEPVYGFDPDYDPVPPDLEVENDVPY